MTTPIFPPYIQRENRVTATVLAVLERLSLTLISRVLGALLSDDAFRLVSFENQVKGTISIPDARISGNSPLWIETKTERNSASEDQVRNHLEALHDGDRLLLLTPDDRSPSWLSDFDDKRLTWANFRTLGDAIEEILEDTKDPPSEREAFLLRELTKFLEQEGLLYSPEDHVLVVAARFAWPEYQELSAYICQPKRAFRRTAHLAFYSASDSHPDNTVIHSVVPRILEVEEEVTFQEGQIEALSTKTRDLAEVLLRRIKTHRPDRLGETNKVLFLSARDSGETIKLENEVKNNLRRAFTQGHRYVPLKALLNVTTTRQLKALVP